MRRARILSKKVVPRLGFLAPVATNSVLSLALGVLLQWLGTAAASGEELAFQHSARQANQQTANQPTATQQEPTVQDILSRHYEARGGIEKLRALDALEFRGTFSAGGTAMDVVVQRKRPQLLRMEISAQGKPIIQSYDGESAWGINPLEGMPEAAELVEQEAAVFRRLANFDGVLVGYRRMGARLAYSGLLEVDGEPMHQLEVTHRDGVSETVWLGEDYLEKRWRRVTFVQGVGETQVMETVSAYAELDGVKFISLMSVATPNGVLQYDFTDIKAAQDLTLADFQMPGQEADDKLSLGQILERHKKNRLPVGAEAVRGVKASGNVVFQGFQLPMTMVFQRPSSARVSIDMQGMEMVLASNGTTAWTVSPMQGITTPEQFGPEAKDAVELFSDFLWGLLTDHAAKGIALELIGIEKTGRHQAYHLRAKTKNGDIRDLWLGGEDFLELKISLDAEFLGTAQTLVAELDDYRAADGILMPHKITVGGSALQIKLNVDTVAVDPEIDPSIFEMPEPVSEGKR